jgi:hypothetical protein
MLHVGNPGGILVSSQTNVFAESNVAIVSIIAKETRRGNLRSPLSFQGYLTAPSFRKRFFSSHRIATSTKRQDNKMSYDNRYRAAKLQLAMINLRNSTRDLAEDIGDKELISKVKDLNAKAVDINVYLESKKDGTKS